MELQCEPSLVFSILKETGGKELFAFKEGRVVHLALVVERNFSVPLSNVSGNGSFGSRSYQGVARVHSDSSPCQPVSRFHLSSRGEEYLRAFGEAVCAVEASPGFPLRYRLPCPYLVLTNIVLFHCSLSRIPLQRSFS